MIEMSALVPELDVDDVAVSLNVYQEILGFKLVTTRPEEGFAYIRRQGADIMLQQATGPGRRFRTAPLEKPYGRGINLQIAVDDASALQQRASDAQMTIVIPLEERWYRQGQVSRGNRQFVVADPDGYLLRFYTDLGTRPTI